MGFFETFVALRYLRGVKRAKGFIPLSTFISVAGIMVGVMALIVVIGVMTGFDLDLKKTTQNLSMNITIPVDNPVLSNFVVTASLKQVRYENNYNHGDDFTAKLMSFEGTMNF